MLRLTHRWVLLLPFLVFGAGVWLYFQTQNEVRVQVARAQRQWREAAYEQALEIYQSVCEQYPKSRYADDALFEMGTISYVNLYDANRALSYFQQLVAKYPDSSLVGDSYLKLADINEAELDDPEAAIDAWTQFLAVDPSMRQRRRVHFRMANAYLRLNRFDDALQHYEHVLAGGQEDHLADQASIGIGTILQIKKEYSRSIGFFQQVLGHSECPDCRLQAQLGLIESYQFTDELPKAIKIAKAIHSKEYPETMKEDLLKRLTNEP